MVENRYLYTVKRISSVNKPRIIAPGPHISMDFLAFEKPDGGLVIDYNLPGGAPTYTLESLARYLRARKLVDRFQLIAFTCQGSCTPTGGEAPWANGRMEEFDRLGIEYIIHVYDVPMTSYTGLQTPFGPINWILNDPDDRMEPISYQEANRMIPEKLRESNEMISDSLLIINAQPPSFSAEIARIAQKTGGVYTAMLIDAYPTYRENGKCPFEREIVEFVDGWRPSKGCILVDVNEREATAIRRFCENYEGDEPLTIEEIEEAFFYFSKRGIPVLGTLGPFGNVFAYMDEMVATPSFLRSPYRGKIISKIKGVEAFIGNFNASSFNVKRSAFKQMFNNIVNTCGCGDSGKGRVLGIMLETSIEMGWDASNFRDLLKYLPLEEEEFKVKCSVEANAESRLNLDRPSVFSNPPISTILSIKLKKVRTPVFYSVRELIRYMEDKYGLRRELLLSPPKPMSVGEVVRKHREICVKIHSKSGSPIP